MKRQSESNWNRSFQWTKIESFEHLFYLLTVIRVVWQKSVRRWFLSRKTFQFSFFPSLFFLFSIVIILASRDIIKMAKRAFWKSTKRSKRLTNIISFSFFFLVEIFVQRVRINERYYSNSVKPRLISIPANRIPSRIPSATSNVFW